MKRTTWLSCVAVLGFVATSVVAGTRPNFSGRWTCEPAPGPKTGPGTTQVETARGVPLASMGSGWGSKITITQDPRRLKVGYEFFAPTDMQPPVVLVYALDGTETENSVLMGRGRQVQISKAEWVGTKLVITTRHTFQHPRTGEAIASEVKQKLSLESPHLLIVEAERSGVLGGPSSTNRTVYRKY